MNLEKNLTDKNKAYRKNTQLLRIMKDRLVILYNKNNNNNNNNNNKNNKLIHNQALHIQKYKNTIQKL